MLEMIKECHLCTMELYMGLYKVVEITIKFSVKERTESEEIVKEIVKHQIEQETIL